jgi:protein TonB
MTLNPALLSLPPPGTLTLVPPTPVQPPPPSPANIHPRLINPFAPPIQQPLVPWPTTDDRNQTTTNPPAGGTGPGTSALQPPLPVSAPARGIAWTHTIPAYPPTAARLNEQGSVRLMLHIDEQGNVVDASVIGSSGFEALDAAAVAWVKEHWRYQPATRDGAPVPASTEAIVTFQLTNRRG